ncbi:RDD family protein [Archangium primigenium]|nr:RDD family protein [Archangium primigenium]
MLDKDIHIDRRRAQREEDPATLPSEPALPPGMIARPATPPGMAPAQRPTAAPPPTVRNVAPVVAAPRPPPAAAPQALAAPPTPHSPMPPTAVARPGVSAPAPRAAPPPAAARPPGTPGLPVMPPRPAPAPVAPPVAASEAEDASFSVDVDEEAPETLPVNTAAPVRPVPAPVPVAAPAPVPIAAPAPARAKPVAPPMPAAAGEVHARPASLWRRLLAFSIDTGAIAGIVALYLLLASSVAGVHKAQTNLTGLDAFLVQVRALQAVLIPGAALLVVLSLVYCAVAAFLWNGRTLGRWVLGLKLVDTRGMAPAPGRAIVRALLACVSFGFFLAGFWMALFDRRGQTLHDKLTSTYVVRPS